MYERQKKRPLYLEIEMDIKDKIKKKVYKTGDKMPSETQICEEYGVSRITAVRALNDLEESGHITRVPGKGSFVRYQPQVMFGKKFYSYEESTSGGGHEPSSRTIDGKTIKIANTENAANICGKTFWSPDEEVIYIKRLRYADGVPSAISITFIPMYLFDSNQRKKLEQMDYREINSMIYTVTDTVDSHRSIEETTAVTLDSGDAALLEINTNTPVIKLERTTFSNNRVVEYTVFYMKNMIQHYRVGRGLEE